MKYFIVDLDAEAAVAQLGDDRVELLPCGSLRYRLFKQEKKKLAGPDAWSNDWKTAARVAYEAVSAAIASESKSQTVDKGRLERLKRAKRELVDHNPDLEYLERQLKLF